MCRVLSISTFPASRAYIRIKRDTLGFRPLQGPVSPGLCPAEAGAAAAGLAAIEPCGGGLAVSAPAASGPASAGPAPGRDAPRLVPVPAAAACQGSHSRHKQSWHRYGRPPLTRRLGRSHQRSCVLKNRVDPHFGHFNMTLDLPGPGARRSRVAGSARSGTPRPLDTKGPPGDR